MMPGRAVGRRGHDAAAGRVLLVHGERVEVHPVHRGQRIAQRRPRGGPGAPRCRSAARRRTFSPPGSTPSCSQPRRTHSCITSQRRRSPARISGSAAQRHLVREHHVADRGARGPSTAASSSAPVWKGKRRRRGQAPASAGPARPLRRRRRSRRRPSSRRGSRSGSPLASTAVKRIAFGWHGRLCRRNRSCSASSHAISRRPSSDRRPGLAHGPDERADAVGVDVLGRLAR